MGYTWPSHRSRLLAAEYSKWIAGKIVETINEEGDAYFVTFMYHPLPGKQTNKIERMGQDIERIYNRLLILLRHKMTQEIENTHIFPKRK
jgi:hypothetical protein